MTYKEMHALWESFQNGNISHVRERVQELEVNDVLKMIQDLLVFHHADDVGRFARLMRTR